MSELESLVSRASQLAAKVDFWNSAVLISLLITALAAGAIVFSQRLAFVRAKQLAEVKDKIAAIKEADAKTPADALDQSNTTLRIDLEKETGKVAGLQRDAANAKAAQQRVEIELAKQQERAAQAEQQLAAIRNPREMPVSILPALKAAPVGKAMIAYQTGNQETFTFAMLFWHTLIEAGWQVPLPRPLASTENVLAFTPDMLPGRISGMPPVRVEIALEMRSLAPQTKHAEALSNALITAHIPLVQRQNHTIPQDTVLIVIGPKLL